MNEYPESNYPIAYLITIRSYGTWLHGNEKGSIDRHGFNIFGTPRMFQSQILSDFMKQEFTFKILTQNLVLSNGFVLDSL
jgi:hypothetical protein